MKEYINIKGISKEWICDSLNITVIEFEGFFNKDYFSLELLDELTELFEEAEDFFLTQNYIKPSSLEVHNEYFSILENKRNELKRIGIENFLNKYISEKVAVKVVLEEIERLRR